MFSNESINIHYPSPTSKLLKLNTFNEFELNRIRKMYAEQLPALSGRGRAVPRSKSTSRGAYAAADEEAAWTHFRWPPAQLPQDELGAGVDLNRYRHALGTSMGGLKAQRRRPGSAGASARVQFARARRDFVAREGHELSVKTGDLVRLLAPNDSHHHQQKPGSTKSLGKLAVDWLLVEDCQSGLQGLVPASCLELGVGCALAKRDVYSSAGGAAARDTPMLPMTKGEPIALLRRLKGHWYEASNTRHSTGLVWCLDVDVISPPLESECEPDDYGRVRHPTMGGSDETISTEFDYDYEAGGDPCCGEWPADRRRAKSATGARREQPRATTDCPGCCAPTSGAANLECQPRRSTSSPFIGRPQQQEPQLDGPGSPAHRLCRAKFAYRPRQPDELELEVGDVLLVLHECDDGWLVGSSYATGKVGTFPGNFVELLG